jgi:hypothetical protein
MSHVIASKADLRLMTSAESRGGDKNAMSAELNAKKDLTRDDLKSCAKNNGYLATSAANMVGCARHN